MKNTVHKLLLGVSGPSVGYAVSLTSAELWLRVLSLVIGCAVGVASLISICLSIYIKYLNCKSKTTNKDLYQDDEPTTTI